MTGTDRIKLARLGAGPEVFYSIQGEGPQAGAPSVFVRLSRCNLYCTWCDTPYTWNWHGTKFRHSTSPTFDRSEATIQLDITELTENILRHDCRRVILTGGEPLLQQSQLAELISRLRQRDGRYVFETETNGTRMPTPQLNANISLHVVSPKLSNSGVDETLRLPATSLEFFSRSDKSVFKFVVGSSVDLDEVHELAHRHSIDHSRIYLMPLGTTTKQLDQNSPRLVEACLRHGFRFSDRLHIRLFGDRPGV